MKLVSCKEAAEYFGIHANTLRLWHSRGRIAAVDIGNGRKRYDIESIKGVYKDEPYSEEENE